MRAVIVGKDSFGSRVVIDAVRSLANVNLVNQSSSVSVSNIETLFSRPLLVKPCLNSDAIAAPCTPGVSVMVPINLPLSGSTTSTCVP